MHLLLRLSRPRHTIRTHCRFRSGGTADAQKNHSLGHPFLRRRAAAAVRAPCGQPGPGRIKTARRLRSARHGRRPGAAQPRLLLPRRRRPHGQRLPPRCAPHRTAPARHPLHPRRPPSARLRAKADRMGRLRLLRQAGSSPRHDRHHLQPPTPFLGTPRPRGSRHQRRHRLRSRARR